MNLSGNAGFDATIEGPDTLNNVSMHNGYPRDSPAPHARSRYREV
jgi:hypothetical protein